MDTTTKSVTEFERHGFRCIIKLTEMGWFCGYVDVPADHRLHGVGYFKEIEVPPSVIRRKIDPKNVSLISLFCADVSPDASRLQMDLAIDVHGGLNYARPTDDGYWRFGFDCSHAGDARTPQEQNAHNTWRDSKYVQEHCERLALQLKILGEYQSSPMKRFYTKWKTKIGSWLDQHLVSPVNTDDDTRR